jgi:uracil-DNA glycosylase family 4
MDRDRSRRYLQAMGVQVWRLRGEGYGAGRRVEESGLAGSLMAGDPALLPTDVASEPLTGDTPGPVPPDAPSTMGWEQLRQVVTSCRGCELCETRTQTVFGVGNRGADLMIIGEAPGADEDRQGEPFVGRAGQLLNLMLEAIGLKREQVYIANILKCRPPGNRDPRPQEAQRCEPYLMRQMALVQPRVLLSVGRISAQNLLRTAAPIGRLRGRWHKFGPDRTPLMVTYHPAYLLRSPDQKSTAWQDLLQVARQLRTTGE